MEHTLRTSPRQHQVACRQKLAQCPTGYGDVFAYEHEMGCGKTYQVLWDWYERAVTIGITDLLVVAPAGSYRNWFRDTESTPSELTKHLPVEFRAKLKVCGWVSGPGANALRYLEAFLNNGKSPRAFFVNIEALSRPGGARKAVTQFLSTGRAMMVIDESTRIRNGKAERTDFIIRAGVFARARRIMTGLIAPRSPLDVYHQFEFLNPAILGQRSFFTFRMRYAVMKQIELFVGNKPRKVWIDIAWKNQAELKQRMAPFSFRVLKSECLDLPPKLPAVRREIELTKEQKRVYHELVNKATAELDGGTFINAERRITQIMKLHQVVVGWITDEGKVWRPLDSDRTTELLEILEETTGKAVVWCTYDRELRAISDAVAEEYGEKAVARYWGGNTDIRYVDEERFKGDPDCRFMFATPASGGVGNNWIVANTAIYHSYTYDLEHRAQSEDRIHRDGQTAACVYIDCIAPGTVEERILKVLQDKRDMAKELMGDDDTYREWLGGML
jgi:hypothetical protein